MNFELGHDKCSTKCQTTALCALSCLSKDVQDLGGLLGEVIQLAMTALESENASVLDPALQILGNIVYDSDELTQAVLDNGILKVYRNFYFIVMYVPFIVLARLTTHSQHLTLDCVCSCITECSSFGHSLDNVQHCCGEQESS